VAVAGVDLGGSKIAGVLLDDLGEIRGEAWREHAVRGPDEAVALIAELAAELTAADPGALTAVGVCVAGWLSRDRREVLMAANLGITGALLTQLLAARLSVPVLLENDGNAAAFAEYARGAGQSARVLMLLSLGTGVGGGLVDGGQLVVGSHGLGGELGHITVDRGGGICSCGARGCLEFYASGPAPAAQARLQTGGPAAAIAALAGGPGQIRAGHVVAAARAGDGLARELLAAAGRAVGHAVAAAMPVIDPDLVVLSGSVAISAAELILTPAREELARDHPLPAVRKPVPIVLGRLGAGAAAIGAAELARRHFSVAADPGPRLQNRTDR
jgi:glucokinase